MPVGFSFGKIQEKEQKKNGVVGRKLKRLASDKWVFSTPQNIAIGLVSEVARSILLYKQIKEDYNLHSFKRKE